MDIAFPPFDSDLTSLSCEESRHVRYSIEYGLQLLSPISRAIYSPSAAEQLSRALQNFLFLIEPLSAALGRFGLVGPKNLVTVGVRYSTNRVCLGIAFADISRNTHSSRSKTASM